MARLRTSRLASLGVLLSVCLVGTALAQERFTRQVSFDIAAQSVEAALLEFSKQADVQVMVGTTSLNGQKTEGVKGTLSVKDALQQLLRNTGLEYQTEGNSTVTIRSAAAAKTGARVLPLVDGTRMARRDEAGEAASGDRVTGDASQAPTMETLDEILVTGSHIRGVTSGAPVLAFTQTEFKQSGFATVQDWIDTLPQNFSGGQNEEVGGVGNFGRGVAVDLRGLGTGATLVLVNGRRQPVSGLDGDFVDVSSIPASAIERIEVLTDGASALYGSDAVGGVVNFILRKEFDGAETSFRYASADGGARERVASQLLGMSWDSGSALLDYQYYERSGLPYEARSYAATADKRALGGDDFRSANSNPGNILDFFGQPLFAIPGGQDGTNLTPADLLPDTVNLSNPFRGADLLPERTRHAAFAHISQSLTDRVALFAEGRFSERKTAVHAGAQGTLLVVPDSNPFFVDAYGGLPFVLVGYDLSADFGIPALRAVTRTGTISAGTNVRLGETWKLVAEGSWARETFHYRNKTIDSERLSAALADPNEATAFNPFGDGSQTSPATLESILVVQDESARSNLKTAYALLDGPVFSLRHEEVKLAVGAEYRSEQLERGSVNAETLDRNITSAFMQVSVPLVSPSDDVSGAHSVVLTAAGRFEDYSDFGSTFNPMFSLRYSPLSMLQVHGTWGTSFRAPKLLDFVGDRRSTGSRLFDFPDPNSTDPSGTSLVLVRFGGNPDLKEETADTWSAGFTVSANEDFSASLSYYNVAYRDRILMPGPTDAFQTLFLADQWGEIVERNPSRTDVDAICTGPTYRDDVNACLASTPAAIIDFRLRNIASTRVSGLDLLISKSLESRLGALTFALNGNYVLNHEVAVTRGAEAVEIVDTIGNPLAFRTRASIAWDRGPYSSSVALNHAGSYEDNRVSLRTDIDSWNTVDLRFSYLVRAGSLAGLEIALNATNVLDEDPPFVNAGSGYDIANATPIGRFMSLQLTKSWGAQ